MKAWLFGALALQMFVAGAAWAVVPSTVGLDGRLQSAAGGPVADGEYAVTFALYDASDSKAALWSEQVPKLAVKSGAFAYDLGATKALDQAVLGGSKGLWLGVAVGVEPELPKTPLQSVLFARRAQVAEGLGCTGCVNANHLDPQVLGAYAKSADLANYVQAADLSAYVKATALAKVAGTGQYADLVGLPVLVKVGTACGTGLVVKGIKADGGLDCGAAILGGKCAAGEVVTEVKTDGAVVCAKPAVKGGKCEPGKVVTEVTADGSVVCGSGGGGQLPADGLAAVSNGLLTNVFDEVYPSKTTPKFIPDNNPGGVLDEIVVPETGIVQEISISVDVATQDLSGLVLTVFDPLNNPIVLHSKSGSGSELKTSFPVPTKLVSGDLAAWVGKNPKGTWRIVATDWKAGGTLGQLLGWGVKVKVLSTTKVAATAGLIVPLANGPMGIPEIMNSIRHECKNVSTSAKVDIPVGSTVLVPVCEPGSQLAGPGFSGGAPSMLSGGSVYSPLPTGSTSWCAGATGNYKCDLSFTYTATAMIAACTGPANQKCQGDLAATWARCCRHVWGQ